MQSRSIGRMLVGAGRNIEYFSPRVLIIVTETQFKLYLNR